MACPKKSFSINIRLSEGRLYQTANDFLLHGLGTKLYWRDDFEVETYSTLLRGHTRGGGLNWLWRRERVAWGFPGLDPNARSHSCTGRRAGLGTRSE